MDTTKQRLLDILTQLQVKVDAYINEGAEPNFDIRRAGICVAVGCLTTTRQELEQPLTCLMSRWPKRSSHANYPVPASVNDKSEVSAKRAYYGSVDKWQGSEYADLRRELLAWMIEELKK